MMAICQCPECGKEISDTVSKCIHCGYRKGLSKKVKMCIATASLLLLIATILLVALSYIYVFDGHYYFYVHSEFGSEFNYSGYQVHSNDCYSNIFLKHNTIDPEAEVTTIVNVTSYIVIAVGILSIVVHLYMLLCEKYLRYCWLFPLFATGSLAIHSIEVSASKLGMIGMQGYYEIRPSIVWFVVIALEILAAVLGKKAVGEPAKGNQKKSQPAMNCTTEGFVDAHGNFHCAENDMMEQDILR